MKILFNFFYPTRNLGTVWNVTKTGPEAVIEYAKTRTAEIISPMKAEIENESNGEYLAHDIDFRKTLRLSTINNKQVLGETTSNITIDSIDVVSYTQPRDIRLTD